MARVKGESLLVEDGESERRLLLKRVKAESLLLKSFNKSNPFVLNKTATSQPLLPFPPPPELLL